MPYDEQGYYPLDDQEVQPYPRPPPFASPREQYGASIIELTNPQKDLREIELTLRAQAENKDGETIQLGEPLMNDRGINSVMGIVRSIINQVTIMSNFDEKDIPMIIDFLADTMSKDLMLNRISYGITNPSARDRIYFMVWTKSLACLKRAVNNGERGFWKGSQQDIRYSTEMQGQGKGLLGGLLGWGKK
jgi:hypothetical protein